MSGFAEPVLIVAFNRPDRVEALIDRLREVRPQSVESIAAQLLKEHRGQHERSGDDDDREWLQMTIVLESVR